ncbi:MAG: zinc ribbon domain-containing protein [Verrucomicrobia bacterium]|nr:zinc ribbon domain-containing protein [Verrucomicrobiota bacterium]
MPTYEYKCEKCNRTFETFQSMKDEPLVVCPQNLCRLEDWGHGKVKRLIGTGAGLIFKGSGFYTTDYRSSNYKESAKKEGESSKEGAKGGADKAKEGGLPSTGDGAKSDGSKGDGAKGGADKAAGSSGSAPSTDS